MSMSTHVIGFKPPDAKWKQMKAIWDACEKAGIEIPKDVVKYFNHEEPDLAGVEVEIDAQKWNDDGRAGYEINVDQIPKDVKTIRFYNSW